jgi:nicotinate phosphoribosyltransferase
MYMDFAKRASDHLHYNMDPIVRSRMDSDFYKLVMKQLIYVKRPSAKVSFKLKNRTTDVRLADIIPIEAVREQLEHVRTLRYRPNELIWIAGNTFYGKKNMFSPAFVHSLETSRLPDYELTVNKETGQFEFETEEAAWADVSDWEIHVMSVINELRNRAVMKSMSRSELDIMYSRAKTKLAAKIERLKQFPDITVSDFGTRRRHSFLWQKWVNEIMAEMLGTQFVGTSNSYLAMTMGLEARGTNAHELPMVYAALASGGGLGPAEIRGSQYRVLQDWQTIYGDNLRVFLPDTFGTTQFLENAPEWIQYWTGARPDSKGPIEAGEELISFWKRLGQDPVKKLTLFSDGMDVHVPGYKPNGEDIIAVHKHFKGRTADSYGWGTTLTNDFVECPMGDPTRLKPLSLVCKVHTVNGKPAVKISDNPSKATSSSQEEIQKYLEIFGHEGIGESRQTIV